MNKTEFENTASDLRNRLVETARFYLSDAEDAEDVAQECMLKLWMIRDRVEHGKSIIPLGVTMAKNLCIDRLRRMKTGTVRNIPDHYALSSGRNAQTDLEEQENERWLQQAIAGLPDKYKAVLHMKQTENMENADIARIICTTEGVVRVILSRARKQLMQSLKQRYI